MHYPLDRLKSPWMIFVVTMLGTFMATLDSSIVNVALPVISSNFGADLAKIQWVVTAYLLTISSLLPIFGRAGDMFGRRRIFSLGFLVFTIGSIACSAADSVWLLVGARVLQALGASMLMSNAPAIVASAFPGKERGRALGMTGTVVALGSMSGPSIGGLVVGSWGWESIFYINIPIGILAFLAGQFVLPHDKEHSREKFDFIGAGLFAAGMFLLLLALSEGHEWGWTSIHILIVLVAAISALTAFVYYETKTGNPMIDLSLFKCWPFSAGSLAGLFSFMAMFTNTMLLPFYLHSIMGLSPMQIGILITPFPLIMGITAPISGYLSERISAIYLTSCGLTITLIGLMYLTTLNADAALVQVAIAQAVMGLGNGLFQSPNNNSVLSSVPISKVGLASGINALVRNVGMVSGIASAVSVFESRQRQILDNILMPTAEQSVNAFLVAYHTALTVGACFAGIGLLISLSRKGYNIRVI